MGRGRGRGAGAGEHGDAVAARGRGLRGREALQEYFRSEIPLRRGNDADDLFSVLCNAESDEGETFSDEDIVNHMIFLLMAAHDTSTITMTQMRNV